MGFVHALRTQRLRGGGRGGVVVKEKCGCSSWRRAIAVRAGGVIFTSACTVAGLLIRLILFILH